VLVIFIGPPFSGEDRLVYLRRFSANMDECISAFWTGDYIAGRATPWRKAGKQGRQGKAEDAKVAIE
jgi:hypothetical protein